MNLFDIEGKYIQVDVDWLMHHSAVMIRQALPASLIGGEAICAKAQSFDSLQAFKEFAQDNEGFLTIHGAFVDLENSQLIVRYGDLRTLPAFAEKTLCADGT